MVQHHAYRLYDQNRLHQLFAFIQTGKGLLLPVMLGLGINLYGQSPSEVPYRTTTRLVDTSDVDNLRVPILLCRTSTPFQSDEPLYVIDGVPIKDSEANKAWQKLDPAHIENIQILKEASATAIYGTRGANGVVLITTNREQVAPPARAPHQNFVLPPLLKVTRPGPRIGFEQSRFLQNLTNDTAPTDVAAQNIRRKIEEALAIYKKHSLAALDAEKRIKLRW